MFNIVQTNKKNSFLKIIDIGACSDNVLLLDESSMAWGWGASRVGSLGQESFSTSIYTSIVPVFFGINKYTKLATTSSGVCALDGSSYAWTWGEYVTLGHSKSTLDSDVANNGMASPQSVVGGKKFRAITGIQGSFQGYGAFIGLDESSYAWSWGSGSYGYLGDNTLTSIRSSPVSVVGDRKFAAVVGGLESCLAIDSSGYAWTWGRNPFGECGDNTITTRSSPVSVLGNILWKKVVGVTGGFTGIDISSNLWSWGTTSTQTQGGFATVSSPLQLRSGTKWLDLYASGGSWGVIALDESSNQWGWGWFVGTGSTTFLDAPTMLTKQFNIVKGVGCYSNKLNAYLTDTGEVYTCSSYAYSTGLLDTNPFSNRFYKTGINRSIGPNMWDSDKIKLGLALASGAIIDKSSNLWTWGDASFNAVYVGTTGASAKAYPTPMNFSYLQNKKFKSVDGGGGSFIAIDENGVAWSWGNNLQVTQGTLGDGTTTNRSSPVMVTAKVNTNTLTNAKRWKDIKLGKPSTTTGVCYTPAIGLDALGFIYQWGYWPTGTMTNPTSLKGGKLWRNFDTGIAVAAAIDISSFAWCWGNPAYGSLGNNATTVGDQISPVSVVGGYKFIKVSVGHNNPSGATREHVLALDASSYIWAWGNNDLSQLGTGGIVSRSSPTSVLSGKQFIDIFALGRGLSMALDASSYLYWWGLGSSASPVSVPGGKQWKYLRKGASCVMGIPSDSSTLWVSGSDTANALFYLANHNNITQTPTNIYEPVCFKAPVDFFNL